MKIVLCDIDNCIADDGHRIRLIQDHPSGILWAKYHLYHMACLGDKADFIPEMSDRRFDVYYISGMPEAYRPVRMRWFFQNGKRPDKKRLHLRRDQDTGVPAVEIKRRILIDLLTREFNPEDVVACYDDRREIVQMYNDMGLPGVHRAIRDDQVHYNVTGP